MKKIAIILMIAAVVLLSAIPCFAEEAATEAAAEANMFFEPMNFVNNLGHMGAGMLGIFVVIGIIVIVTVILNKVTSRNKN